MVMKKLEKIAMVALALTVASPALAQKYLPPGFKEERQEMPNLSGEYKLFSIRWETLPDGSIAYHMIEDSPNLSNYVEEKSYYVRDSDGWRRYSAFFRVCNKIYPENPYYLRVTEILTDKDLKVFVDMSMDGISEFTGIIKKNPLGASPVYDYNGKNWYDFIPECEQLLF